MIYTSYWPNEDNTGTNEYTFIAESNDQAIQMIIDWDLPGFVDLQELPYISESIIIKDENGKEIYNSINLVSLQ